MMIPSSELGLPRRARANRFGRYPNSDAAARIRLRVSSRIGTPVSRPFRIRETVVTETPAWSATCRSVTEPVGCFIRSIFDSFPEPGLDTSDYRSLRGQTSSVIVKPSMEEDRPASGLCSVAGHHMDGYPRFGLDG